MDKRRINLCADTTGAFDDDNARSLDFNGNLVHAGANFTGGTLHSDMASVTEANRAVGISHSLEAQTMTFFITGVQLEVGQNPTEFEHEPFERTLSEVSEVFLLSNGHCK